ncbi:hypothetical protein AZI86_10820 [Bdellovibrio bacteriovorus]|uniref:Mercuric transport protein MerT n=1 Tax=Bdellovibrio bacteriovorus TaxID=959 RepID=A0A150WLI7_BDEBC|nr:hypothetical protein [Bdellovibrio bacteriovorus]KYG64695.1 hypothetical protein AZI86_10820 [Bdellovibrio bacteriovorus]
MTSSTVTPKIQTNKFVTFLTLFSSTGTLICCALPALLVSLGMGAVLAGLAGNVPGLIWVSENKGFVFIFAGVMLALNGVLLWRNRNAPCPLDPELRNACISGRRFSARVYGLSVVIFLVGFFFAFLAPILSPS